jgi:hypothetical protein
MTAINRHINSNNCPWTLLHPVINFEEIFKDCDDMDVEKITLEYMDLYGIDNVRGGTFSDVNLSENSRKLLNDRQEKQKEIVLAKKLMDIIDSRRASEYGSWMCIGSALHNISETKLFDTFDEFSKKASNDYDHKVCKKFWKDPMHNELTIKTLVFYAKNDNPEKFEKLLKEHNLTLDTFKDMIKEPNPETKPQPQSEPEPEPKLEPKLEPKPEPILAAHILALQYYENLVTSGNVHANDLLRNFYFELGNIAGKSGDVENTIKYYKLAIGKGHADAVECLDDYYLNLSDVAEIEKDYDNAVKYYKLYLGDMKNASTFLGNYYNNLAKKMIKSEDYDNAVKHFLMAIDIEHVSAMNNLGKYYCNIKHDYDNAMKYFMMAVGKGNAKSMNNIGEYSCHVTKDYDNAVKFYEMAIKKGNIDAMSNLGWYYCNIKNDREMAKVYYEMFVKAITD